MTALRDISISARPREKLQKLGAAYLTTAELLALVLNTSGQRNKSVVELANEILGANGSLRELAEQSSAALAQAKGIGPAKAAVIQAVFELAHRYEEEKHPLPKSFHSPAEIAEHYLPRFRAAKKEVFTLLCLTARHKLKNEKQVSVGNLSAVATDPREIFGTAFQCDAAGIILLHNHPSGDPSPSGHDETLTSRLQKTGELIGIPLLDHIILGARSYFSFQEAGLV
jgi:DNA repair protein RadC